MPHYTMTAATIARQGIQNGNTDEAIIDSLRRAFPYATTPYAVTVSYYRAEIARQSRRSMGVDVMARVPSRAARRGSYRVRAADVEDFDGATLSERAFGLEFEFVRGLGAPAGARLSHFGAAVRAALAPWPEQVVNVRDAYFHSNGRTWDVKLDGSCEYELATPRLTRADWPKVVAVLKALKAAGADVDERCGFHVHHETRGMRTSHLRNLIRMWGAFDEPMHLSLPKSRRANRYAYRMDSATAEQIAALPARNIRREIRARERYVSLNLLGWWRHGRVEVRSHHGTLDADKAGHWTQMTQAIVDRAKVGRLGSLLAEVRGAADRFSRLERVIGETAARVLAAWARSRNPEYFSTLLIAEAA